SACMHPYRPSPGTNIIGHTREGFLTGLPSYLTEFVLDWQLPNANACCRKDGVRQSRRNRRYSWFSRSAQRRIALINMHINCGAFSQAHHVVVWKVLLRYLAFVDGDF